MPDNSRAATNLALAQRLSTVAASVVTAMDEQHRGGVTRPRLDFRAAGLSDSDRLTLNNSGIRACRLRDRTVLQLTARDVDNSIMTMVEAHSGDPAVDLPASTAIRQIRTGVLLWNEAERQGNLFPHAYVTVSGRDEQPFALVRASDIEESTWKLRRRGDSAVSVEYPSFAEAILDIGDSVDIKVGAERAARLRMFEETLTAEDLQWATDAGRRLGRDRPGHGLGI